jgi:hypothetical protein
MFFKDAHVCQKQWEELELKFRPVGSTKSELTEGGQFSFRGGVFCGGQYRNPWLTSQNLVCRCLEACWIDLVATGDMRQLEPALWEKSNLLILNSQGTYFI